jgi:L-serine deaminase
MGRRCGATARTSCRSTTCIEAMRQAGEAMSANFKETSLGGLAVNLPEC